VGVSIPSYYFVEITMPIFNLGSINADLTYRVPHIPSAGETLAAQSRVQGLGGKGANMSVAAARAAARTIHIGAIGPDGQWAADRLFEYGVDTRHIFSVDAPTGHAVIAVDKVGENMILLFPGANQAIGTAHLATAFAEARAGDFFLFQNETSGGIEGARMARAQGLRVVYAAAPFDASAVEQVLPLLDMLVLNEVEAMQLHASTGLEPRALPVQDVVITLGSKGARWLNPRLGTDHLVPARKVDPVDTTGAGDTFTGYLVAALDRGMPMEQALSLASDAAALMVTRHGTADVIPDLAEVHALRGG
jgi:ribokinase